MYRTQPAPRPDQIIALHQAAGWMNRIGQAAIFLLMVLWGGNCIGAGLAESTVYCDATSQCQIKGTVSAWFRRAEILDVQVTAAGKKGSDAVLVVILSGQPRLRIVPALSQASAWQARDQLTAFAKGQLPTVTIRFPPAYSRVLGGALIIVAAIGLGVFFFKSRGVGGSVKSMFILAYARQTLLVKRPCEPVFDEFPASDETGVEAAVDLDETGEVTRLFQFVKISHFEVLFQPEHKAIHRPAGFALGMVFDGKRVRLTPFRTSFAPICNAASALRNALELPVVNDRVVLSALLGGPMSWSEFARKAAQNCAASLAWVGVLSGGVALQATYWPALAALASIPTALKFLSGIVLCTLLIGIAHTAVNSIRLPPWTGD